MASPTLLPEVRFRMRPKGAFGVVLADQQDRALEKRALQFATVQQQLAFERLGFLRHNDVTNMPHACRGDNLD